MYNPDFNYGEFAIIKSSAGLNSTDLLNVALFGKTAREWKTENPKQKGNIRDYATIEQL